MRLLVVGAEGATGRDAAGIARGHGHEVTELGPGRDRASLEAAVHGCDAVISTLAVDGDATGHDVTADLVRAMTAVGAERLVVASWAGAGGHTAELALSRRLALLFAPAGRRVSDADVIEGDVMLSDLAWTIVRAHGLSDRGRTGHYRVVEGPVVPKGSSLPREDLAAFLVKVAESGRYERRIVAVAGEPTRERG